MGQKKRVLEYIEEFGSISSLEAFRDLGITRLSDVIFRLKKDGYGFETSVDVRKNRFGETCRFARYSRKDVIQ